MNNIILDGFRESRIINEIEEHIETSNLLKEKVYDIKLITNSIINALKDKNKILTCGNGGSASDSSHLSSEIVGRYQKNRNAYPSINLVSEYICINSNW